MKKRDESFKKKYEACKKLLRKKKITYKAIIIILIIILAFVMSPWCRTACTAAAKVVANTGKKLPIYCVDTGDDKKIAISFDAAWGADDTEELLSILEENDVKTTFFMCGYWVEKYPDKVKLIHEAGHDLGNHSATHPHMAQLSKTQIAEELQKCRDEVKSLTGYEMDLFRPPFGEYTNSVIETAEENGYYTVQWDVDSLDWKEYGVEHEVNQVLNHKHLGNGSIILFHNDAEYTPDALDRIIKGLKEKGYEIVPISELIMRENFTMNHEGRQIKS